MEENKNIEIELNEIRENTVCKDFESSNNVTDLIGAMLKFHNSMGVITKDATNPFYKNTYATLSKICREVNPKLNEAGLFILQLPMEDKEQGSMYINTRIYHESGQWMSFNCCSIKKGKNAQDIIGDSTYLKRASLTSLLFISLEEEDNDGEENRIANQNTDTPTEDRSTGGRRRR